MAAVIALLPQNQDIVTWGSRRPVRTSLPAVVLVVLSAAIGISALVRAGDDRPVVVVYGDSLTVQSEAAARQVHPGRHERVIFRARGGTAMCDWVDRARVDVLVHDPAAVVLAFTGNTATCVFDTFRAGGVPAATALYERSLRQFHAIFAGRAISVVIPPAMHNTTNGWFPFNGDPALVAMYERVGRELGMTVNTRADDTLSPGHVFSPVRPAYPDGPLVTVRLSDGIHLTPAGALWYGAALLAGVR
jgi:hypothetical protein